MSESLHSESQAAWYRGEIQGLIDRELTDKPFFEDGGQLKKASVFLMESRELQILLNEILVNHGVDHPIPAPESRISSAVFHTIHNPVTKDVLCRMIQFYLGFDTENLVENCYNSFLFLGANNSRALLMVQAESPGEFFSGDATAQDLRAIWQSTRDPEKTADLN